MKCLGGKGGECDISERKWGVSGRVRSISMNVERSGKITEMTVGFGHMRITSEHSHKWNRDDGSTVEES